MLRCFIGRARRLRTLVWVIAAWVVMAFGPLSNCPSEANPAASSPAQEDAGEDDAAVAQEILRHVGGGLQWGEPVETPRLRSRVYAFSLAPAETPEGALQLFIWIYEQDDRLWLQLDANPPGAVSPELEGEIAPQTFGVRLPGVLLPRSPQSRAVGRDGFIRFRLQSHPADPQAVQLALEITPAGRIGWPEEGDPDWRASFHRDAEAVEAYRVRTTQVGVASWYGRRFAGRPTASGEPFNPDAMTAAHRKLPLGSRVRVTNLENGRTALVRINDRGPYVGRRIIDVSRGVAERLGFRGQGITKVRLDILERRKAAGEKGKKP